MICAAWGRKLEIDSEILGKLFQFLVFARVVNQQSRQGQNVVFRGRWVYAAWHSRQCGELIVVCDEFLLVWCRRFRGIFQLGFAVLCFCVLAVTIFALRAADTVMGQKWSVKPRPTYGFVGSSKSYVRAGVWILVLGSDWMDRILLTNAVSCTSECIGVR